MIRLRTALAIALTSGLSLLGFAPVSTAQTSTTTTTQITSSLPLTVTVTGPRPSGVTGYVVVTTCRLLQGGVASSEVELKFFATGGSFNQLFNLTPNSHCSVKVTGVGTGAAAAKVVVTFGTVAVGSGGLGTDLIFDTSDNVTPVTATTPIEVAISFPSLTVRKVLFGVELVPGADYTIAVACLYDSGVSAGGTTFKLKGGTSKVVSVTDIPGLDTGADCYVAEIDVVGAAATTFESTVAGSTSKPGLLLSAAVNGFNPFTAAGICPTKTPSGICTSVVTYSSSSAEADGQTVTVTNRFVGDLQVSKVVAGDPKSNIAIYEINVACSNSANLAPNETFLLKDRQTKLFSGVLTGTACTITETRSDGAVATFADNSGDNATDGKIIVRGSAATCNDPRFTTFPDCRANVIITNSYGVSSSAAPLPTAPAPATTLAAPATTSASLGPAPIDEPTILDESEETVG
jgi:hypothetical protein